MPAGTPSSRDCKRCVSLLHGSNQRPVSPSPAAVPAGSSPRTTGHARQAPPWSAARSPTRPTRRRPPSSRWAVNRRLARASSEASCVCFPWRPTQLRSPFQHHCRSPLRFQEPNRAQASPAGIDRHVAFPLCNTGPSTNAGSPGRHGRDCGERRLSRPCLEGPADTSGNCWAQRGLTAGACGTGSSIVIAEETARWAQRSIHTVRMRTCRAQGT